MFLCTAGDRATEPFYARIMRRSKLAQLLDHPHRRAPECGSCGRPRALQLNVDVIASNSTEAILAVRDLNKNTPVVMVSIGANDPKQLMASTSASADFTSAAYVRCRLAPDSRYFAAGARTLWFQQESLDGYSCRVRRASSANQIER
jgi:hypothetical protein